MNTNPAPFFRNAPSWLRANSYRSFAVPLESAYRLVLHAKDALTFQRRRYDRNRASVIIRIDNINRATRFTSFCFGFRFRFWNTFGFSFWLRRTILQIISHYTSLISMHKDTFGSCGALTLLMETTVWNVPISTILSFGTVSLNVLHTEGSICFSTGRAAS